MADKPPVRFDHLDGLPLSRRELLLGAGGLVLAGTLAGCGSSGSSSASSGGGGNSGTPKPGGNFRLGVTGPIGGILRFGVSRFGETLVEDTGILGR